MDNSSLYFNEISLLVTHYNRSASLERLLKSLKDINCSFNETVISDDGSNPEHYKKLLELEKTYGFKLVGTEENKGLGNNINKGQAIIKTTYTLYIQEDFLPTENFPQTLKDGFEIMEETPEIDIVRFFAFSKYPFLKPFKKGFSEMIFNPWPWYRGYLKFYYYSDHPHLRRQSFTEKFGKYAEGVKGDVMEYRMMMSYLRKKGKSIFFENYPSIISHDNSDEPSIMEGHRGQWRKNPLFAGVRSVYLSLKFVKLNFDLLFMRL